jgi:hypothetical protein
MRLEPSADRDEWVKSVNSPEKVAQFPARRVVLIAALGDHGVAGGYYLPVDPQSYGDGGSERGN